MITLTDQTDLMTATNILVGQGVWEHPDTLARVSILDDARELGVTVLGLDVNASGEGYRVEPVGQEEPDDDLRHAADARIGAEGDVRRVSLGIERQPRRALQRVRSRAA